MIQKERTRSLQLIDEVAEIFQISSLFLEQLDKVTRELQNLIPCYKNIYCSKSQTHVQSCHQFLLKKKSSPSLATAKPSAEKQVAEKYNFIHFFCPYQALMCQVGSPGGPAPHRYPPCHPLSSLVCQTTTAVSLENLEKFS